MAIYFTAEYSAAPEQVLGILTDTDFLKEYAAELQVLSHESKVREDDGVSSIHLRLIAPTDNIPSIFRGLVGSEIVMNDRREWSADGDGGYVSKLDVKANVKGRPISISGSLTLSPSGIGTQFVAVGQTHVEVRFIGGPVRDAIDEAVTLSFGDETIVMLRWLQRLKEKDRSVGKLVVD